MSINISEIDLMEYNIIDTILQEESFIGRTLGLTSQGFIHPKDVALFVDEKTLNILNTGEIIKIVESFYNQPLTIQKNYPINLRASNTFKVIDHLTLDPHKTFEDTLVLTAIDSLPKFDNYRISVNMVINISTFIGKTKSECLTIINGDVTDLYMLDKIQTEFDQNII